MSHGFFITFEGIEGSGKTTQAENLNRTLLKKGYSTLFTREPGGTEISEKIRAVLLDRANTDMFPLTELLLYLASRAQLVHEAIFPALEEGMIVLSDRFADSTLAYQGGGRGIDRRRIQSLNTLLLGGRKPDLTFLFDLPPEEGLQRGGKKDRMEMEQETFYRKVRDAYRRIARENPERVRVINGRQEESVIEREVLRVVEEKMEKMGYSSAGGLDPP
ncbi:dTMP kinase [candidate division TA06 bacterium]|nr:dTMP kinase [candidate division TA06 bacterium]